MLNNQQSSIDLGNGARTCICSYDRGIVGLGIRRFEITLQHDWNTLSFVRALRQWSRGLTFDDVFCYMVLVSVSDHSANINEVFTCAKVSSFNVSLSRSSPYRAAERYPNFDMTLYPVAALWLPVIWASYESSSPPQEGAQQYLSGGWMAGDRRRIERVHQKVWPGQARYVTAGTDCDKQVSHNVRSGIKSRPVTPSCNNTRGLLEIQHQLTTAMTRLPRLTYNVMTPASTSYAAARRLSTLQRHLSSSKSESSTNESTSSVKRLTVFGAGLMGAGICQVGAQNGIKVSSPRLYNFSWIT